MATAIATTTRANALLVCEAGVAIHPMPVTPLHKKKKHHFPNSNTRSSIVYIECEIDGLGGKGGQKGGIK